ncbi:phospho-sugar mutase [Abyssisolibacter fermentans]|uniref:phospho-sugar mutase n=1 Tax=Abyssisolibacter fermentans TaxID=1766203 RepID=UPI00082F9132|nr:phospho-sugar mutase [Abyssisolibacter fermentans]
MEYRQNYDKWLNESYFDESVREELMNINNNEEEIKDRFYKNLTFGTAGLRGKIGAGTNRMNKYTVALASQALALTIISQGGDIAKNRGVAIAYDTRKFSDVFAKTAALVLAYNGIKVYLFDEIKPTPVLAYTIRKLGCYSGIMITASHNPKEYNGYKVYWNEGSQILSDIADKIIDEIESIKDITMISLMDESDALQKGLLKIIDAEIYDAYIKDVLNLSLRQKIDKDLNIIYTPLNGTGNRPVRRVLKERGFKNVFVVKEQENPDPNFTTVGYPNPENINVFDYAKRLGKQKQGDIIIATDPDCDRMACMVTNKDKDYTFLNGNQIGALLINYILDARKEQNTIPKNGVIVKTIVTGELGKKIAQSYGVETIETLTGFKNICQNKNGYEKNGKYKFIFGYEESIGYVYSTIVRDKDGVIASMLLCEAAAYYKLQGKTLLDVLEELFQKYGYFNEKLVSIILEGKDGRERINRIMGRLKKNYLRQINNNKIDIFINYEEGKKYNLKLNTVEDVKLPNTNGVKFVFEDNSWFAVRPSGTEPKLKIYIYSISDTKKDSEEKTKKIEKVIMEMIEKVN